MDRKTIVRYVLDLMILIAVTFGGWTFGKINTLERNQVLMSVQINSLDDTVTVFSDSIVKLTEAVDSLVVEQQIQTRIKKLQISDRWTSSMMEEFQNIWFEIISQYHEELRFSDIPNIHHIQAEHLESLINDG